ncbi:MAG TPA: hypothetical protein VMB71_10230 [Acetobacteraceae bacterium]|nr:hypothetical protein [Acetobacteraceae bacterium]
MARPVAPSKQEFFASFFQERRIFFSEEKKQKTFVSFARGSIRFGFCTEFHAVRAASLDEQLLNFYMPAR